MKLLFLQISGLLRFLAPAWWPARSELAATLQSVLDRQLSAWENPRQK
jgi:hypothetical protein